MTLDTTQLTWDAPGAGRWQSDTTHFPGSPTPMQREFHFPHMAAGIGRMFERYGVPMDTFAYRLVNGRVFSRLMPLIGAEKDATKMPPAPVLWLAMRLHPEFRKRTKNATHAMGNKIWRDELRHWQDVQRGELYDYNHRLQAVDLESLDDAALAAHVREVFDHVAVSHELHFELHGTDLVPLGDFFANCQRWGISANEGMATLQGSSPASVAPASALAHLAKLVADAPVAPRSLDEVRALGSAASDALTEFLDEYGWRIVTAYDIDGRCLIELPDAILGSIAAAGDIADRAATEPDDAFVDELRSRVPADERALFDELLAESRTVYGLRDENGPLTIEWPVGLLRRAVLECGRRLQARGLVHETDDAVELSIDELSALVTGASASTPCPTPDEITARGADRRTAASIAPPKAIGPDEPAPPLAVMPAALRRVTQIAIVATSNLEAPDGLAPMHGLGIGTEAYSGTARVGERPEEVLMRMEPGDVLVVPSTTPAFNTVLAMAGAVVCEEGGALCHAAVMAREFGFPAVVGAKDAMTIIKEGDRVEVDATTGRVRVLS